MPSYRIRFIRSIMPGVRLIFLMRNPVERAWSHAVMSLVKHTRRRIEEIPRSRFYTHFVRHRERGCYSKILDRWLRVFPAEQLYISVRTVEGHRKNLLDKTGTNNSVSLAVYALKSGMLD